MATNTIAIASLPNLPGSAVTGADILPIVDVSDLTDPGGTTKAVTIDALGYYSIPHGGRTVTNLQDYLANNAVFNVKDFGAVGDGITDDTAAIQSAINAASTNPGLFGACVYFPPGQYRISAPLILPQLVSLLGNTTQVTEIFAQGCTAITMSPSSAVGPTTIRGLIVYCQGATSSTSYIGINIPGTTSTVDKCTGLLIQDCQITNFNIGIYARTLWWSAIRNTNIYDCWNAIEMIGLCVGVDIANVNGVLTPTVGTLGPNPSIGLTLNQDTYPTGGAQQPQAIHVVGGQFSGFGYGCNHAIALQTTVEAVAFDQCTLAPVRFVYGNGVTTWLGCYFGLVGSATGYGFEQIAVGTAGTGICLVQGCSFFNGSSGSSCIGFVGAALQVNTILDSNFFSGWTGNDISLISNSGGNRITNNACSSVGLTNSIVISASSNTIVFGNICAAAQTTVAPLTSLPPLGGAAAPTTGAHVVGELMWLQTPVASGFLGYVCTAAGTPGTWQKFGFIGPNMTVAGTFGCNGAVAQSAAASGGALATYTTGAFGLDSDAHMHALYSLVVAMRAALVANGIMS